MNAPAPLRGRKVVDLSQYIAGAVCGQLLADYGAEVLKVGPPGGDPSRALAVSRFGSAYFRAYNTGKSAATWDLRAPADRQRLDELLDAADAVVMNFGRRTRARLGLDAPCLHRTRPHLVVTVVSAYGAGDPRTCFDSIAQAVSGYALLNAAEDGRPRVSAGYPTDVFSGLYAGTATAMALLDPQVGTGVEIDVPMIEVAMDALTGPASLLAAEQGDFPRGRGNQDAATAPSNVYRCRDGHAYVYAGLDKHWARLRPVVDGPEATAEQRLADPGRFDDIVQAWTLRHPVAEVCARLQELDIPAGPVRDPVRALRATMAERPGAVVVREPSGEAVPQYPAVFSGIRLVRRPAPRRQSDAAPLGGPPGPPDPPGSAPTRIPSRTPTDAPSDAPHGEEGPAMTQPAPAPLVLAEGSLDGLSALVTGAGSGIGRAVTRRLNQLGARVAGLGRHEDSLRGTGELLKHPDRYSYRVCDVRDTEAATTALREVGERDGLGLLVNNAGGQFFAPATQISPGGWSAVLDLNLTSVFHLTKAARPYLAASRGSVVNISLSGVERGGMGMAHSIAARAGVLGLTRSLALEWADDGIRLNCLGPGTVLTHALNDEASAHVLGNLVERATPMRRPTPAPDVAELVAFLASPAGALMTGQLIQIDGGAHLGAGLHMLPEAYR